MSIIFIKFIIVKLSVGIMSLWLIFKLKVGVWNLGKLFWIIFIICMFIFLRFSVYISKVVIMIVNIVVGYFGC